MGTSEIAFSIVGTHYEGLSLILKQVLKTSTAYVVYVDQLEQKRKIKPSGTDKWKIPNFQESQPIIIIFFFARIHLTKAAIKKRLV